MADNYLEKKMEDYRRGVNSVSPRRSHNLTSKYKGLSTEQLSVALVISNMELLEKILYEFRQHENLKTAFAGNDQKTGSRLAQSTSSLFVPCRNGNEDNNHLIEVMYQRWGAADVIITDNCDFPKSNPEIRLIRLCPTYTVADIADRKDTKPNNCSHENLTTVYFGDNNPDFTKLAQLLPLLIAAPASIISTLTVK